MTLKSSLPPPPIEPATTVPVLTPIPDPHAVGRRLVVHGRRHLAGGADGALGVVGVGLGGAEDRQQPVADELVDVAAVAGDDRDDLLEEAVERGDDLLRVGAGGEAGEVLDVAEEDRDLELDALLGEALAEDVLGDLAVEVGAERLADPLALGEADHHLVERRRQLAELVAGGDRDADLVVALLEPLGRLAQVVDRAQHRLREQDRQLERDRRRDRDRDEHVDAEVGAAAVVRGERGDDEAGDQVDQRQRRHQPHAQRDRRRQVGARGDGLVDVDQHRAHPDLERQVVEDRAVADGDQRGAEEREEGGPGEAEDRDRGDAGGDDDDQHRQGEVAADQVRWQARRGRPGAGRVPRDRARPPIHCLIGRSSG